MTDTIFNEQSTGVFVCSFEDEDGTAIIPNRVRWTLTTTNGQTVINNREHIDIAAPETSVAITLQGNDLQVLEAEMGQQYAARLLTVEAEYDSDLGSNLPLIDALAFKIKNSAYTYKRVSW